jgi:class 3 adenylate cyclase/tetratricopeptide (TPR) repeat protein
MGTHGMGCPGCGTAVGQEDRFCRFCGYSLGTSSNGQERRFVTALYTDLCGYTALSARVDQEELKALVDSIFQEASRIIASFGGVVEKFLGDAVVALFGISHTHEDDIIRAIRAASLIHDFVGRKCLPTGRFSMHTGIHAGTVLVDRRGFGDLSLGAMGMPINIAARLSGIASPGEILVGGSSIHEAQRFFLAQPLGGKKLKGIDGLVQVHRIISPRPTPWGIHRPDSASSPLVGRKAQLAILMDAYHSGKWGQVLITGVPGAGKSRLALEFMKLIPKPACAFTVHCLDHMKDIPYEPVISLIRQMTGAAREDGPGVDGAIETLLENPRHAFHIRSLLGMKQGLEDLMPDVWKTEMADAVASLVQAFSRSRSLVICIEDFQWADATSRDLFLNLSRQGPCSGCLLVITSREDHRLPAAGIRIVVEELPLEHMKPMLLGLLPDERIPDGTGASFHRITGGNPLFIEEYLSFLREKGLSPHQGFTGDVPSTVHGIIAARMEALGASCKALLQAAAVAGVIFPAALLKAINPLGQDFDQALHDLERAGFICMNREGACSFRHALTREAAYASLLVNHRRELHRKIGFVLEGMAGNKTQNCGSIAFHLFHACEFARAYPYCMLAARTYQAEGSWMEATTHYAWARECLLGGAGGESRDEMLMAVCEGIWSCSRIFNPDRAIAALEELASLYRQSGRTSQEVYSRIRLINLYSQKALFGKALETFDAVFPGSKGSGFLSGASQTAVAYTYTFLGQPLKALEYLENARSCLHPPDRFLLMANHLTTLAACVWRGDVREALSWYARTKEGSAPYLDFDLMAEVWLGYVLFLKGEIPRGREVLDEVRAREKKLGCLAGGFSYLRIQSSIYLCSRYTGDLDTAREDLAMAQAQGSADACHAPLLGLYRAWIALEDGRLREAAALAQSVLPSLEKGIANRVPYALNTLAEALYLLGDLSPAEGAASRCLRWNAENGNVDQLIWALRILSSVHLKRGRTDASREALRHASHLAGSWGLMPHSAWNLSAWGDYHAAQGRWQKASSCHRRAQALWEAMGCPNQAVKIKAKQALQGLGSAACP